MANFKTKMHQIVCRLGLRPRPRWESLQRSPRPPSWILGALFLREGRGGKGKRAEGKGRERRGGRKEEEGREREWRGGEGRGGERGEEGMGKGGEGMERRGDPLLSRYTPPPAATFQIKACFGAFNRQGLHTSSGGQMAGWFS